MTTTRMKFLNLVPVVAKWLGTIPYDEGLRWQSVCYQKLLTGLPKEPNDYAASNTVLMLEHFPVYTVGVRGASCPEQTERRLECLGADFYRTDRGGLITFHGPGQLVVYPILHLPDFHSSPFSKWYVHSLEQCLIGTCLQFGVEAYAPGPPLTGVWVNERKVASIGLRLKDGISSHGVALNCDIDLGWFEHIDPCGLVGRKMTSLSQEVHQTVRIQDVIKPFIHSFEKQFRCEIAYQDAAVKRKKHSNRDFENH
ncbi:hypothetical protein M514_06757 [Trichuris suis]|uniref:Octanoyl-[acyl-carrier-protein]:protein N-octanoyltransferase LIPT2, mitochondrial n=1 Tax=Trichuris suis TaxID=68888 RepID=A0A085NKG1_9BILA|nr:hypothetical protein M513_06757 [Trichuris suis]KFD69957.1 hypothetical protein M514_06757 [Trichuris suis]KHJ42141.1 lipoyl(octanoyl) transferase [Trichuris suis]